MVLERSFHLSPNRDVLHWIAKQIADYTHVASIRQLYQHSQIGSVLLQSCMRWVPNALPTKNLSAWFDLRPIQIE